MKLEIKNRAELWAALKEHDELFAVNDPRFHCRWDDERGPQFKAGTLWEDWNVVFQISDEWHTVEPKRPPPPGYVYCTEAWEPDSASEAVAYDATVSNYYLRYSSGELSTGERWIRPAGVPVSKLREYVDRMLLTGDVYFWRDAILKLCAKHEAE